MTVLYEVKTKHTKEMMKAFAKFNTKMSGMKPAFKLLIIAALFFMLPRAFHTPGFVYVICWGIGILFVLLLAGRSYVTYFCMCMKNEYYKEEIPITMQFGNSKFKVLEKEDNTFRYTEIEKLYADKGYFYFQMEDAELFIIPKSDFVKGDPEAFADFMERNTGKVFGEAGR